MSKKLPPPKSPLDEILVNFPFSISPINLKFFNLSDKGAITLARLISISLVILTKLFLFEFLFKYLGKLLASNKSPFISIFLPSLIEKSLFFF